MMTESERCERVGGDPAVWDRRSGMVGPCQSSAWSQPAVLVPGVMMLL
jgi:hypothetical protein